jgi:hypothetical protein
LCLRVVDNPCHTPGVRWERLFEDLEAQLDAADRDEFAAEVADRTRREVALIGLLDRFRAAVGRPVELTVEGAGTLRGVLRRVGSGWVLLDLAPQPEVLVTARGILAVRGLGVAAAEPAKVGAVDSQLDFGYVMRAVARDRAQVSLMLRTGSSLSGTVDRVGADFVDLAEHDVGAPRRAGELRALRTVAFAAISVVR